jgi:hypothetical protein
MAKFPSAPRGHWQGEIRGQPVAKFRKCFGLVLIIEN